MELMQLEMFVAVVEERSFLRAAERVFRTQPAVSISVRKLEGKIGTPLFDRSHRRSGRLTTAGEVLYDYACRILVLRDEALSALKKKDTKPLGTLRVGLTGGVSFEWVPQLTKRFNQKHPGVRLEILYDNPVNFFRELTEGRLDVALLSGRPRGDARSKEFVITRVRGARAAEVFWMVRRKLRASALVHAFEERVLRQFERAPQFGRSLSRILSGPDSTVHARLPKRLVGSRNASR
jgi:DNA-binding transcriptional LysR family regulator